MGANYVKKILLDLSYSDPDQTYEDVVQVLRAYDGLRVWSNYFVVNNGVEEPNRLLSITGTTPVKRGSKSYPVGVVIWVPKSYPSEDPEIFLIPKSKSAEGLPEVDKVEAPIDDQPKCQFMDVHGKVDIFELRCLFLKINKNRKEPCNLTQLIDVLVIALSKWTPSELIALKPLTFNYRMELSYSVRRPWRRVSIIDHKALLLYHNYENLEHTARHIINAVIRFPTLDLFLNEFVYNNGTAEMLLTMSGVVQLEYEGGNIYNIQISIWLPKAYPFEDPVVFVKFINDDVSSRITRLDYMDRFGKVDFSLCQLLRFSLVGLIKKLLEKWRADLVDGASDADDGVEVITAKSCLSSERWPFPKRLEELADDQSRSEASTPAVSAEPDGVSVTATYSLSNIEPSAPGNDKMDQNQQPENHSMQTFSNDACVICDDPSEVIGTGGNAPLSEDEVNQLMTLCRIMMPNQNDIPKVIRREMFPLCGSCKELAKELWECEVKMEKIKAKIESKVVEEVNLSGAPIPSEEANNDKRFMKLRSVIYQGYLNKLRLKKNERLAGKYTTADQTPPIISSESNGKPAASNPTEDENSRYQLPLEVERSVTGESMVDPKVEVESRSGAEEEEFGDPLFEEEHTTIKVEAQPENTDEQVVSLNAPVSVPRSRSGSAKTSEGTLLVETEEASVKFIWTKDLSTSEAFLECSFENCNHSVPFGTTIEEMNEAYESSSEHIQRNHKDKADRLAKRFGKQQHFQCPFHPTCKLQFADSVSADKHEIIHRSCGRCGKKFGKIAFYKNPSLMLSHKCPQKKAEKRNVSADQEALRPSQNKRFKYVPNHPG